MVHQPAIFEACEAFKHDQMHPEMFHCSECKERTWANEKQSKIEYRGTICVRCIDQQKKDAKEMGDNNVVFKYSAANDMDPLNGPQAAIMKWLHLVLERKPISGICDDSSP